jgi:hypothetical protein
VARSWRARSSPSFADAPGRPARAVVDVARQRIARVYLVDALLNVLLCAG